MLSTHISSFLDMLSTEDLLWPDCEMALTGPVFDPLMEDCETSGVGPGWWKEVTVGHYLRVSCFCTQELGIFL